MGVKRVRNANDVAVLQRHFRQGNAIHLVHSPSCGHCLAMKPHWRELTRRMGSFRELPIFEIEYTRGVPRALVGNYVPRITVSRLDRNGTVSVFEFNRENNQTDFLPGGRFERFVYHVLKNHVDL
jgi:hypothetical protein